MNPARLTFVWMILLMPVLLQCSTGGNYDAPEKKPLKNPEEDFGDYWYRGKAEITSFELEQARYGEIHKGQAVLIFVTEDFSKSQHVKLDEPGQTGDDAVTVMKLNKMKKFNTGIYPYTMMTSVFTPVNAQHHPHTLKVTTSSQEWCGHTFTQLNLEEAQYRVLLRSYFESEGDRDFKTSRVWLEDGIWTRIRTQPENLPTGTIDFIPGTMYSRLRHSGLEPLEATATLSGETSGLMRYHIQYPEERELNIYFEEDFPHRIVKWDETYRSGFGDQMEMLTTRAQRIKTIKLDYWNRNSVADSTYRQALGL